MKKINKIFSSAAILATSLAPMCVIMTSCVKENYKDVADELKEETLKEFKQIVNIPRSSGYLTEIREYIRLKVESLGHTIFRDRYGNLWWDVPASKGCENWKKVILQGHMDMVYAGPETKQFKPIVPEFVKEWDIKTKSWQNVVHSRDHETSLGADDGIGVATMLALSKNNNAKHGSLRCVITCDEETGCYGANSLGVMTDEEQENPKLHAEAAARVLDSDYMINLDGELDGDIAISSYGLVKHEISKVLSKTPDSKQLIKVSDIPDNVKNIVHPIRIDVQGLAGGHSGENAGFARANAERLAYEILNKIVNTKKPESDENYSAFLYKVDHISNDINIEYQSNAIIPNAALSFYTDADTETIDGLIEELIGTEQSGWKQKYTGENWNPAEGRGVTITSSYQQVALKDNEFLMSNNLTSSIAHTFGGEYGDKDNPSFPCGVIDMIDKDKKIPGASCNIGPTVFDANNPKTDPSGVILVQAGQFTSNVLARAKEVVDINNFEKSPEETTGQKIPYSNEWVWRVQMKEEESKSSTIKKTSRYQAWNSDYENNKVYQLMLKGYKDIAGKKDSGPIGMYGGLECSSFEEDFTELGKSINIICIGPRIDDCHTQAETLYVDTMDNELTALLYTLAHIYEVR